MFRAASSRFSSLARIALFSFVGGAIATPAAPAFASPMHEHLAHCGLEEPQPAASEGIAVAKENGTPGLGSDGAPAVVRARALTEGALLGKTVYVSPGHGWNYSNDAWRTQRGNTHNIVEDFVSTEAATQYLIRYLRNMGAYVVSLRENDLNTNLALCDDASPSFSTFGNVALRDEDRGYGIADMPYGPDHRPFRAGTSKVFDASSTGEGGVRWTFDVPEAGNYNVYVGYVQGPDRAGDAAYTVRHAGGSSTVFVDQRRHGNTWVFLGNFYFRAGSSEEFGSLELAAQSAFEGATLSADIARLGGGESQVSRDGTSAGRPAFEDSALSYLQSAGAPTHVLTNDVQARSRFAAWDHEDGEDAVYIAWHTNANNGEARGTSSFAYGPTSFGSIDTFSGVEGSVELLTAVHNELLDDLRSGWDSEWNELGAGLFAAYFGEINPSYNPEMPSGLFEIAFHDNAEDAAALADPRFRRIAGRAMAQGVARYFSERDGTPLVLPPDEPEAVAALQDDGAVRFVWQPAPLEPGGGDAATRYRIYLSRDGLAFDDGHDVDETSFAVEGAGPHFARITALNAGGESLPSPIVGARASNRDTPMVLVVSDFERLDSGQLIDQDLSDAGLDTVKRMLLSRMNNRSHIARYGRALDAHGTSFASATAEALRLGLVGPEDHEVLIWASGETRNEPLSASERALLDARLESGGRVILSGSHLVESQSNDGPFLERLGISAFAGDAGSFALEPGPDAPAELEPMRFDDLGPDSYLAEESDALAPAPGATALLNYPSGAGAVLATDATVVLGFPFETVATEAHRSLLMAAILIALDVEPDGEPGDPTDLDGGCGCRASSSGTGSSALLLLALGLLLRRRRGE